jgi:hypothetical protein
MGMTPRRVRERGRGTLFVRRLVLSGQLSDGWPGPGGASEKSRWTPRRLSRERLGEVDGR